jgi:hypothetical protein
MDARLRLKGKRGRLGASPSHCKQTQDRAAADVKEELKIGDKTLKPTLPPVAPGAMRENQARTFSLSESHDQREPMSSQSHVK